MSEHACAGGEADHTAHTVLGPSIFDTFPKGVNSIALSNTRNAHMVLQNAPNMDYTATTLTRLYSKPSCMYLDCMIGRTAEEKRSSHRGVRAGRGVREAGHSALVGQGRVERLLHAVILVRPAEYIAREHPPQHHRTITLHMGTVYIQPRESNRSTTTAGHT